jgi:ankyrin repeat protein
MTKKIEQRALHEIGEMLERGDQTGIQRSLFVAAQKGWPEAAKASLAAGADPNAPNQFGHLPLIIATNFDREHIDVVRVLLQAGAHADAPRVLYFSGPQAVPLLVEAGANVDGTSLTHVPLIHAILGRSKPDKATALLSRGANVNIQDAVGWSPLLAAAARGHIKVLEQLLKQDADHTAIHPTGRSAIRLAAEGAAGLGKAYAKMNRAGCRHAVRTLARFSPSQPEDLVLVPVVLGQIEKMKELLKDGLDPNTRLLGAIGAAGGVTVDMLKEAAAGGFGGLLKSLNSSSADKAAGFSYLLTWAAKCDQTGIVQILLESGANPNLRDANGRSTIDFVTHSGSGALRKMLSAHRS